MEVAGCGDTRAFFRELCSKIGSRRSGGQGAITWFLQRLGQVVEPRSDHAGPWYQPFITLDHEAHFERLIKAMHDDRKRRWAVLIDELPIFLKALHDKGQDGVVAARNFMNLSSRLRADYPCVRWMITGSIGIEPLARAGEYMGVLAKYQAYELQPLTHAQAMEFVQDLARQGQLTHRQSITDAEAQALVAAAGWRVAYYLDALAQKLSGDPSDDPAQAERLVEQAASRLLEPAEAAVFGTWEEHLRKHYKDPERAVAFAALAALAPHSTGLTVDTLLATINRADLTRDGLFSVLKRLHVEGFITVADWDGDNPTIAFRNPLLRRWWHRYRPTSNA